MTPVAEEQEIDQEEDEEEAELKRAALAQHKRKMLKLKKKELIVNKDYVENCRVNQEVPLPAFVIMKQNMMFLCQFRMNDSLLKSLESYLFSVKDHPKKLV